MRDPRDNQDPEDLLWEIDRLRAVIAGLERELVRQAKGYQIPASTPEGEDAP